MSRMSRLPPKPLIFEDDEVLLLLEVDDGVLEVE